MTHKSQIGITTLSLVLLIICMAASTGYFRVQYTESVMEPIGILLIAALLSLGPLYYLKEFVYYTWRKFAMVALPIMAILIFLAPADAPGAFLTLGGDRESVSMVLAGLFLAISWILIAVKAFTGKKAGKA